MRRNRNRLVIEYDDPELMRNLRMIAAAHNHPDVRREILANIKQAHAICHPELGRLIDAEMRYTSNLSTGSPDGFPTIPKTGDNNGLDNP